ncbi:hypothetical protein Tco_0979701 [Tanacetum coccineum]
MTHGCRCLESNMQLIVKGVIDGHAAYIDRFHELARLVSHLVTPESAMIERYVYGVLFISVGWFGSYGAKDHTEGVYLFYCEFRMLFFFFTLTDEAVRNGSIKKVEKRGNVGESSKDKNGRDDNERTRTENAFVYYKNLSGRENTEVWVVDNQGEARLGVWDSRWAQRKIARIRTCDGYEIEIEYAGVASKEDKVIKGFQTRNRGSVFEHRLLIPFGHGNLM